MDLSQALKNGLVLTSADPIDVVLTAYKDQLYEVLQKQIERHHRILKKQQILKISEENFTLIAILLI